MQLCINRTHFFKFIYGEACDCAHAFKLLHEHNCILYFYVTAPFNNMRTLKFKAKPTNAFFATVNQLFGSSSQLPTTAEHAVMKSLCTVQTTKQCLAVVISWEEPPNI